jgi:hypothetical protein
VPELRRLLGHGEAAPIAIVGPAALQARVLEGVWDGDWVFDKDGKTSTSEVSRRWGWKCIIWVLARAWLLVAPFNKRGPKEMFGCRLEHGYWLGSQVTSVCLGVEEDFACGIWSALR